MLKKIGIFLLSFTLVNGLVSCTYFNSANTGLVPIARVFDQYLYVEDLRGVIPQGISSEDSTMLAKNYIDNWIKQQVIIAQANQNLNADQKNFDLQVENYRNSLLIYNYEKNLIDQKLDTVVDEDEVATYYKEEMTGLKLSGGIVKAFYIKVDSAQHDATKLTTLLKRDKPSEVEELRSYCQNHAIDYSFDDSHWIYLDEIANKLPLNALKRQEILQQKGLHVSSANGFTYYLFVSDSKPAGETAPLSILNDEIKQRIIYKRKSVLIEQMRTDLLNDALNNKNVETFSEND